MPPKRRKEDNSRVTWWDGNSTRIWRVTILTFIGLLGFISAYMFNEVTNAPKIYPSKVEVATMKAEIIGHLGRLNDKVDDVNRYLRDNGK